MKEFLGERVQAHIADINNFLQHVVAKSGSLELIQKTVKNMVAQESIIASTRGSVKAMSEATARLNPQADRAMESVQRITVVVRSLEASLHTMVRIIMNRNTLVTDPLVVFLRHIQTTHTNPFYSSRSTPTYLFHSDGRPRNVCSRSLLDPRPCTFGVAVDRFESCSEPSF